MRARLREETSPASVSSSPARTFNNVDLPAPFGPIKPIRSPSETVNEISSNRGTAPKRFDTPCAFKIGGIPQSTVPHRHQRRLLERLAFNRNNLSQPALLREQN